MDEILFDLSEVGKRNPWKKREIPKIVYVRSGVANKFQDCIELHEDLRNFPKLKGEILKHELKHTDKIFTIKDLKNDLKSDNGFPFFDLWLFMVKRPSSWVQVLPIYHHPKRGFVFDINAIIINSVYLAVIAAGSFLVWRVYNAFF